MKHFAIVALTIALAAGLCACGCSMDPNATDSTNQATVMPTETVTVPVPETNIPNPGVNDSTHNDTTGDNSRARTHLGPMQ